ncbi:MAG TPA: 30S ribosome-binding factor RbfA [Burkholderiales bacterium]
MPRDYPRTERIAEQIQRELAELIRLEVKDPRVGFVTLTGVEVTRDYSHAKVFFTTLGGEEEHAATGDGLSRAAGFLRSQLAHRLNTRVVPQLHFVFDASVERGIRVTQLIEEGLPRAEPPKPPRRRTKA